MVLANGEKAVDSEAIGAVGFVEDERWRQCPSCGLGHTLREDGRCPRCHQPVEALPAVEEGPRPVALSGVQEVAAAAVDPAVLGPSVPAARLRRPAMLTALFALALTGAAVHLEAGIPFVAAGALLAGASLLIAARARA